MKTFQEFIAEAAEGITVHSDKGDHHVVISQTHHHPAHIATRVVAVHHHKFGDTWIPGGSDYHDNKPLAAVVKHYEKTIND